MLYHPKKESEWKKFYKAAVIACLFGDVTIVIMAAASLEHWAYAFLAAPTFFALRYTANTTKAIHPAASIFVFAIASLFIMLVNRNFFPENSILIIGLLIWATGNLWGLLWMFAYMSSERRIKVRPKFLSLLLGKKGE